MRKQPFHNQLISIAICAMFRAAGKELCLMNGENCEYNKFQYQMLTEHKFIFIINEEWVIRLDRARDFFTILDLRQGTQVFFILMGHI